jgi:hypothetical protein
MPRRESTAHDAPDADTQGEPEDNLLTLPPEDGLLTLPPEAQSPSPPLPAQTPSPGESASAEATTAKVPPTADAPPLVPPPAAPPVAPPPAVAPVALPGVEHDWLQRWPVYQLGLGVIVVAAVSAIPALLDLLRFARQTDAMGMSRWALALLLAAGLQIAYALYLMQLPDWGTAWVISIVMLVLATIYAALLGALTLAKPQSQFIQVLELGDKLPGHQAAIWCLMMLVLSAALAYFSGRISFRWRRAYWRWARP